MATVKRTSGNYSIVPVNGNVVVDGNLLANVSYANFFVGDGQFLTGVTANVGPATVLQNGNSNVSIPVSNGNVSIGINSTGNVVVVSQSGMTIGVGTASSGNTTGALIVTGGVGVAGNVYADAVYSNYSLVLTGNSIIDGGSY